MGMLSLGTGLVLSSLGILYIQFLTHMEFLLHVAAIPLELLVGALIFEKFLASAERKRRIKQLSYIKGYLFRFDMRNIFILHLRAMVEPRITLLDIRDSSYDELVALRNLVLSTELKYGSHQALGLVIDQYVENQKVFEYFMEWAIRNEAEKIFNDMIYILNFIQDMKVLKEVTGGGLVVDEALKRPALQVKIAKVMKGNVLSLLDYAIELKNSRPKDLEELLGDYQLEMAAGIPHHASVLRDVARA